jgi:hypothetical protein
MANRKTTQLLPQIHQSGANKKFLAATLDQMVSDIRLQKVNGFVGRSFGSRFISQKSFIDEPTDLRSAYQLEPGLKIQQPDGTSNFVPYTEVVDKMRIKGAIVDRHDRLFAHTEYSLSGLVDLDKFVNFSKYYWLPNGPDAVDVFAGSVPTTDVIQVNRTEDGYTFKQSDDLNPRLTFKRGGSYTFEINQPGNGFFIQTEQGISGVSSVQSNISTREIAGVVNNGEDLGEVIFNVPLEDSQDKFLQMLVTENVNLATSLNYNQLHNRTLDSVIELGGIDGQTNLDGKLIVFYQSDEENWAANELYESSNYDTRTYDVGEEVPAAQRRDIFRIRIQNAGGIDYVKLDRFKEWPTDTKILIGEGNTLGNRELWKKPNGELALIPIITANKTTLFYQDGNNDGIFGKIEIILAQDSASIDVEQDILGMSNYTSPNGVQFTNGLKVKFDTAVVQSDYRDREYYVEGVGTEIVLIPVDELITPETFTQNLSEGYDNTLYDRGGFEETGNSPINKDYILINRASVDRNAWSRHNRWFHEDIINKTAEYNNFSPEVDQDSRAKRPIIEFEKDLLLYNNGKISKKPVDLIDQSTTDVMSTIEGASGYFVDGVALAQGMRVLFTGDTHGNVANKIYRVDFIQAISSSAKQIHLVLEDDSNALINDTVVVTKGLTNQGKSLYFDGNQWVDAQQKTKINQAPTFDMINSEEYSISNTEFFNSTSFAGTKIFGYKQGNGVVDTELGFSLSYSTFNNIGDIEFESYLDTDKFVYIDNGTSVEQQINLYDLAQIVDRNTLQIKNIWNPVYQQTTQYQIIQLLLDSATSVLEIPQVESPNPIQTLFVYINGQLSSKYSTSVVDDKTVISFDSLLPVATEIAIRFSSKIKDSRSYYEIPSNLEFNANNKLLSNFTLGQLRNHLQAITENSLEFEGEFPGFSNLRDLGDYYRNGGKIKQNATSFIAPALLFCDKNFDVVEAIEYAKQQYARFKYSFAQKASSLNLDLSDIPGSVDQILQELNQYKSADDFPFYLSDMCGYTSDKLVTTYTVVDSNITEFEISQEFVENQKSYRSVLVYKNGIQLVKGVDYNFVTGRPAVSLNELVENDVVKIVEYNNTRGSFIPPTPTKLGLWYKYTPQKYIDTSYVTPTPVIRGHDGSITVAYGDSVDDLILELEKRIYNNLKTQYNEQRYDWYELISGKFRSTDYTRQEINAVLNSQYNLWSSKNNVGINDTRSFDKNNPFTWNYSAFSSKVDGSLLSGGWRSLYRYHYDTITPHLTPWEMLGFSEKPSWWENIYGPAPYTSGNTILWDDLEQGRVYQPNSNTFAVNQDFVRLQLSKIIPVDEYGNLKSPLDCLVKEYNSLQAGQNFVFGDQGPAETAWRTSSEYPYALVILASLTQPGKFLDLCYDIDSSTLKNGQYLSSVTNVRHKFTDHKVHDSEYYVNGLGQFISDYNVFLGYSTQNLKDKLQNLEINLGYKLAGYSDLNKTKFLATQVTPSTQNQSVFIPDENISLQVHKSQPLEEISYSGVIVENLDNGYAIRGYDLSNPYFDIIPSVANNNRFSISAGDVTSTVYRDFGNIIARVPYGTVFVNRDQVVDFLISYERFLVSQGVVFDNVLSGAGTVQDFVLAAKEFLFWTSQNWQPGNIISLTPIAGSIKISRTNEIVDDLRTTAQILDNNFLPVKLEDSNIQREDNSLTFDNPSITIGLFKCQTVQYEHVAIFDNNTIFSDIVYQPELGNRQQAIKLTGYVSGEWNGTLYSPGFVLNQNNILEWNPNKNYAKGEFVIYKGKTYVSKINQEASASFDFEKFTISDNVPTGMLPNWGTKAGQFENFYNIDIANNEDDLDKFGKGLIGYQKRNYLENLQLDDVSQIKFYQGMLQEKGTGSSFNNLLKTQLDNLTVDLDFYEEWAVRVGAYGAVDLNQEVELILEEGVFDSNAKIVELVEESFVPAEDRYQVTPSDLYTTPNDYTVDLFATRDLDTAVETDIKTAGYASLEDVDFTLFNISDIKTLDSAAQSAAEGSTIWVAEDFDKDWTVYRITATDTVVKSASAVNGKLALGFAQNVDFVKNDVIVLRNFDDEVDGFHIVDQITDLKTIICKTPVENVIVDGSGYVLRLQRMRFESGSDVGNLSNISQFKENEKIWIDRSKAGGWQVLNRTTPWDSSQRLLANTPGSNFNLGHAVSISNDSNFVLATQPQNNQAVSYVKQQDNYQQKSIITPNITDLSNFGHSVSEADNGYIAIGAPASNNNNGYAVILKRDGLGNTTVVQVLVDPNLQSGSEFGSTVELSSDGSWLFVGAPGSNKVFAFNQQTPQDDGSTVSTNTFIADSSTTVYYMDRDYENIWQVRLTDSAGKIYTPYVDFELVNNNEIHFASAPTVGTEFLIVKEDSYVYINIITSSDSTTGDRFGNKIASTSTGDKILVGAPNTHTDNHGKLYYFERSIESYSGDGSSVSFSTLQNINALSNKVLLNGVETNEVTVNVNSVVFDSAPAVGVQIDIELNNFNLVQTVELENADFDDKFGTDVIICYNDCSVYTCAPGRNVENNLNQGAVYRYTNVPLQYGTITGEVDSASLTIGDVVKINNRPVVITGTSASTIAENINNQHISGVVASANGNQLSISGGANFAVSAVSNNVLVAMGLQPLQFVQTINHPDPRPNEYFGSTLELNRNSNVLFVGSPSATTYKITDFDQKSTVFDSETTEFSDAVDSGSVYVFEFVEAENNSLQDPGAFIASQQFFSAEISLNDAFGSAVAASADTLIVGAPFDEDAVENSGSLYVFSNDTGDRAWQSYRNQSRKVDTRLFNSVLLYNTRTNTIVERFDYIDGVKGKIAGPARQNIDIVSDNDPAKYNTGNSKNQNQFSAWCATNTGTIWWDTSTARYLEYEQGTLEERAKYWNSFFPPSTIDVYEWVASVLSPLDYIAQNPQQSLKYPSGDIYTLDTQYNEARNTFTATYFFWVKNKTEAAHDKTLSVTQIADYIRSPSTQGFPFLSFVDPSAMVVYNTNSLLENRDCVLKINYDTALNDQNLHTEFELIKQGSGDSVVNDRLFRKIKDSLAGTTFTGETVPDRRLNASEKIGLEFRPRQSVVLDRQSALENLITFVNTELAKESYANSIQFNNLLSEQLPPSTVSGEWDTSINDISELDFIDPTALPTGYKILVLNDSSEDGLWTIRQLQSTSEWKKVQVQSYKTSNYWSYTDWYATGYSENTVIDHSIQSINNIIDIEVVEGDIIKVISNLAGNFEIYVVQNNELSLIGLQNGTIQLSTALYDPTMENLGFGGEVFDGNRWDEAPTLETHKIIDAIKDDIFIADKTELFNRFTFDLFEYILKEQQYVDWLFKTSFISLEHKIRGLDQYSVYQPDNQSFLLDYISEAKPYHTKVREYLYRYDKQEQYQGDVTDFDVESFYDESLGIYRKPESDNPLDVDRFLQLENSSWSSNYDYSIGSIIIASIGQNYTVTPQVQISAPDLPDGVQAAATARIRNGGIDKITIVEPGSGYTSLPTISLIGGNGSGARLTAVLNNLKTRKISTTIKFDRFRYTSDVKRWAANTVYQTSDLIGYNGEAFIATQDFTSGNVFTADNLSVYADENFTNANDRINAYYNPTNGMLGTELSQQVYGIEYPGVNVTSSLFDQGPGFDLPVFDVESYDNFQIGPEGREVISDDVYDTIIQSQFSDSSLGLRPSDIVVDGHKFVDEYSSHSPEEMIPGRVFDTLDFKVYQTPTSNNNGTGNGINIEVSYLEGDGSTAVFEIAEGDMVVVYTKNLGPRYANIHYEVDYANSLIVFNTPLSYSDIAYCYVFRVAGENTVAEVTEIATGDTNEFSIQVDPNVSLASFAMIEGESVGSTIVDTGDNITVVLASTPTLGDRVKIWIFNSEEAIPYSEIHEQVIELDGSTLSYDLDNRVLYTGPASSQMILEYNGSRLRPANSVYYTGDGSTIIYDTPTSANDTQFGISNTEIGVWVDDIKLEQFIDYDVSFDDGSTSRFVIFYTPPTNNSRITVSNSADAEYRIESDSIVVLSDSIDISEGGNLRAITFTNHDNNDIETKVFVGTTESTITTAIGFGGAPYDVTAFDGNSITTVSNAEYTMDRPITNNNYVWVTVDGIKLHPGIDFVVSNDQVVISDSFGVRADSLIVISSFTEEASVDAISWRVFHNMLGEVEYHRMIEDGTTELAQSLDISDSEIYVVDGSVLSEPNIEENRPGVIFVDGERITYWQKQGNMLSRIRRGTGGTGAAKQHPVGMPVIDAGIENKITGDNTDSNVWLDQGITTAADGNGMQKSTTSQAKFLREKRGILPILINDQRGRYFDLGYVDEGYVEINE